MGNNYKAECKGNRILVDFGGEKPVLFIAGSKAVGKPVGENGDITMMNGEVILADKSKYWAVIGISKDDGGEHWETMIFTPNGLAIQGEDNFLEILGKSKEQVYGYKYRYFPEYERSRDHHVDDMTGWSR